MEATKAAGGQSGRVTEISGVHGHVHREGEGGRGVTHTRGVGYNRFLGGYSQQRNFS